MKLNDDQKNRAEGINEEVRKALIAKAGMKLSDNELETVIGGYGPTQICIICSGLITDDPSIPDAIKCHCNNW